MYFYAISMKEQCNPLSMHALFLPSSYLRFAITSTIQLHPPPWAVQWSSLLLLIFFSHFFLLLCPSGGIVDWLVELATGMIGVDFVTD